MTGMSPTRERIIAATNELFRRQGFNGTSLSQISEASEAPIGSIYHFFPGGKEALAVAVIETTGAVYRELFETIIAESDDTADGFAHFFAAAAAVLDESGFIDPCPIGTLAREVANTSEPLRLAAKAAFDSWISAATEHLLAAGASADDARDFAALFVAAIEGNFVLARTLRDSSMLISAGVHLSRLARQAIDRASAETAAAQR